MDKVCEMKYKMMYSPLGKIEISGCEQGLHGIKLHGRKSPDTDPVEAPAPPEPLGSPEDMAEPLMQCTAWLDAYFHKPAVLKELPLPALHHPIFQQDSFTRQVLWKLLKVVKFGEVVSYQQLAALAGNPKAARAVGGAMRSNPVPRVQQGAKQTKSSTRVELTFCKDARAGLQTHLPGLCSVTRSTPPGADQQLGLKSDRISVLMRPRVKTSAFPCGLLPPRTKAKVEKICSQHQNQRDSVID
ncbi:methylated-DNA--protein-cysteine methyltransferase isoform X1 [Diceros bicornis minor]|uniref:methylated-DNA--protein-cysteine methyltransferase isoform X1 n=1 Tax=Diceros bicornis minor TaxID=77932 RepID=UPI0026EF23C4|nr:methylated-DNA--protein-cysteine methyltransferase isoform X1 [Diceros bicornis minor]XP_058400275.1 methylated-DNA--protein-cysteine methyltransferase isoform X1 [Diceros bicornis minor]